MDRTRTVHECLFCPQTFGSAVEKDDHTLEHFAQEVCTECNRNLIRIGSNLYTLHSKETCIENKYALQHHINTTIKTEPFIGDEVGDEVNNEIVMQNEYAENDFCTVDQTSEPVAEHDSNNLEIVDFKNESNNDQYSYESQIKIEEQFVVLNIDHLPETHHDDNFPASDNLSVEFNTAESLSQNQHYTDADPMEDGRERSIRNSTKREKCDVCGVTVFYGTLKRHKINKHNFCTVCLKTFANPTEFDLHKPHCTRAKKPGRNTHCDICNLTLKTRKTYMAHMLHVHNPLGKPYKCECCGSKFRDNSSLKAHTCRPDKDQQPRIIIDPKKHIIDGRYLCDVCNVSLGSRTSLKMHKIFIHKELGEIVCRMCAKPFPTAEDLTQHQIECQLKRQNKNFGDFKTFECDICKAVLKSKDGIRQHIMHTHLKIEKRFKCEECGLAFYAKSEVKLHHKIVHLNIRDFICTTCGKAFKLRYQLKNHEKFVHSDEKYECFHENCNKYFATPMSRKKHMETHRELHGNPPEERVKCDICELSFVSKITLKNHHRFMHLNIRNFKCLICDRAFKSKMGLQSHTYKHTGEKPFACQHKGCDKKFRSQSNRDEHHRSHTGEKPFLCTVDGCERRFRFSVDFRRHKLNVHGVSSVKSFPCSICGEVLSKNSLLIKHMNLHAA